MKKLLVSALTLTLVLSMTACGSNDEPDAPAQDPVATEAPAATEAPTEEPAATEAPVEEPTEEPAGDAVAGETLGNTLLGAFNDLMAEDASMEALTVAEKICAHESLSLLGPVPMAVEAGYLMGFNNYEVIGFDQGVMFAPMIGSIPFVGYVFNLPADADVDAFVTGLKDNADLRWNICVEADEMIAEANGNTVFFLMCPTSLEQ